MSSKLGMLAQCSQKDYYILQVDECELLSYRKQYNVHDTLERGTRLL